MPNDAIGDLITRLANASVLKRDTVSIPFSNLKLAIAEKLVDAGYIAGAEKKGKKVKKTLDITLKYGTRPGILGVKRVSKPGRRLYRAASEIHSVRYGHGTLILTTPKGIKTDKEARKENVGGEALFQIW